MQMPQGPFCQSCAMPMHAPAEFGSNADGSRSEDYCVHCYQKGSFTWPDATLEGMIEFCAGILAKEMGMSHEEAKARLSELMPRLKRWQGAA